MDIKVKKKRRNRVPNSASVRIFVYFQLRGFFEISFTKRSSLMRFSGFLRIPGDPRTTSWVSRSSRNSGRCLECSNASLGTEYSLMMVSRGEVLGARRCSVARVGAVEGVLRKETAIVLVHSTGPDSRAPRELHPGTVLRLELGLHGRRWPLHVPSHVACCRSLRRCGLGLVHRCWCLRIKNESRKSEI